MNKTKHPTDVSSKSHDDEWSEKATHLVQAAGRMKLQFEPDLDAYCIQNQKQDPSVSFHPSLPCLMGQK